jgi:RNA polymerase sigma-70 factor, ECF subfamily
LDAPQHLAGWIYNRCEIEIARRNFMEHRCEQEKVLAIDEGDLDGRIPREFPFQFHGDCEPGKPAAQNEHPFVRCIFHAIRWMRRRGQSKRCGEFAGRPETGPRLQPRKPKTYTRLLSICVNHREHMSFFSEVQLEDGFVPFVAFREAFGFIPNLLHAQTLLPRVVEAQAKLEGAVRLREGAISRLQKERILLSIAVDQRDAYCTTLDSKVLSSLGASEGQIDSLLNDPRNADLSATDLACLQFCLKLARHARSVSSEDVEALRACGFGDEAIFEAVIATALAIYRCTLSVGLGPEPDFAWRTPPAKRITLPHEGASDSLPHLHAAARRKGPYVPAPYLSPKTFASFDMVKKSHGFIPNFFRAQSLRPDLLDAELQAVDRILVPEDLLTRVQKECILLAVSAANLNSYCVAMHCNLLRGLGMPSEEGDQIAVDYHESNLSEADLALLDFAVKLGTRGPEFSREDVAKLRTYGFSEEQILECEVVTALNNFANTLQMGLGIEPDFEPPPAFEQNKVHLSDSAQTPIGGEGVVHLIEVADPDAEWVTQAQSGDLQAFEELVRRHSQLIYRTLAAILGNPADAQDAMQDTLLSAFKHIGGFQGRSKFSTWLVSIARNSALQRLRRAKNVESLDQGAYNDEEDFRPRQVRAWQDNPEQFHSKSEIRQLVERGILALPANYRAVVMLRDIQQLSTDEVAQQLGLSVPTVKTRLLRGRLMLREWLSPHFTANVRGVAQ